MTIYNDDLHNQNAAEIYSDTIFSILLHNIYTKNAAPSYGINYKQNIDKNPFSYFCAFCDTIQKWNRPKQIDFSKLDMLENHYLDNNFDMTINNGKIKFICQSKQTGDLRKSLISMEDFLPGSINLIKISEEEI